MSKVKDFFSNIANAYKKNVMQYTVTHIILIITTAILTFGNYDMYDNILGQIAIIGVISAINAFTCESFCKKTWQRVVTGIIGVAIAVIFERLIWLKTFTGITRIATGYCVIVFLIGIMKVIKNSKLEIHEYRTQIFQNLFNTGIIYLILNIGLSIIIAIFIILLLDNADSLDLLMRLQIALAGFFLAPACLTAITNSKNNVSKFIESIIVFVLLPLIILATIIIYLYMAKIFITKEIPSNSIFRILAGLFVAAFPIWTMAYSFKEKNKIIKKFCTIMPIAFIPFIGLQIYSMGVRCIENGLTPARYLGIMLIVFESIAILLTLYRSRKYLIHTISTGITIVAIATLLPVVNMNTLSNISQANRLVSAWQEGEEFANLSKEQKETASSAYYYLHEQEDGKKYLPEYINAEEFKDTDYSYGIYDTKYISYELPKDGVTYVADYSYIQEIHTSYYKNNDLEDLSLNDVFSVNIKEYILNVIKENEKSENDAQKFIINNRVLKVNDTRDLYIKELYISYVDLENITEENINYISIEGYMLIK